MSESGGRGRGRRLALQIAVPLIALGLPLSFVLPRYVGLVADYLDEDSCLGCHNGRNPHLIVQWVGSAHFGASVSCTDCHGLDHDAMFAADGDVSSKICAGCHANEYESFGQSSHARAQASAENNARFLAAPPAIRRQGCLICHSIGKVYPDGGRGRCNFCHSGHRFSRQEAREPEACGGCHMGPDHPQIEAYEASKHGIVYRSMKDEESAPTCVTCHLGGRYGHDNAQNLTLGRASAGAMLGPGTPAMPMKVITRAEFEQRRERMMVVCRRCHSAKFARASLEDADEIKRLADATVAEAVQIIGELEKDGLLIPMPADRPPHPQKGHRLVLGGGQLYSNTSAIEQRFFEMMKFDHSTTFKGAYHQSPDHTHWLGWARLQADLTFIRHEATRLRALAQPPRPEGPRAD